MMCAKFTGQRVQNLPESVQRDVFNGLTFVQNLPLGFCHKWPFEGYQIGLYGSVTFWKKV